MVQALLLAPMLWAQLQTSLVSGRVVAPDGAPMGAAHVVLRDRLGTAISRTDADDQGRFTLVGVAPGAYELQARTPSLASVVYRLAVADGLPVDVELRLAPQLSESVVVGAAGDPSGSAGTTLAGDAVRHTASSLLSNVVRAAVGETAGWTSEDNGLLHYRGSDDGLLFVVDGIPIYERLDPQFGLGVSALSTESVRVLSGHVPAEFGMRTGGVVEVHSQMSTEDSWSGLLETEVGRFRGQGLGALARGPMAPNTTLAVSLGAERSRRFLDPVTLDNLHNEGGAGNGELQVLWAPGQSLLSLGAGHAASTFEVPNEVDQAAAGQDQHQTLEQTYATLNWQRSWSAATVSRLALFGRLTNGTLSGSRSDTPLAATARRQQDRVGLLFAVTRAQGRHRAKAGFEASWVHLDEQFRFVVTDADLGTGAGLSDEALAHTPDNPFSFSGRIRRPLQSLYVQDAWQPTERLTVDVGVRQDRSHLLLAESQWSPRLGLSYQAGSARFRASVDRLFQPPQTEYLLLGSSPEAQTLSPFVSEVGAGGADVRAERQTAFEAGVDVRLGPVTLDVAAWRRSIRNQGDPNVLLGTTIIVPNSVSRGRAQGLDVRLELPRRGRISGFLTYTLAKVEEFGPIDGGLFLEDDVVAIGPGTRFTPDHDQRHALSAKLGYQDDRTGFWASIDGRYRSGTPLDVSPDDRAVDTAREGADFVDFPRGRTRPYTVFDAQCGVRLVRNDHVEISGRAAVLNVAGARYAFNFGNPFSGTHFGAPRTLRIGLRLALR
jgi:hypothetical protein